MNKKISNLIYFIICYVFLIYANLSLSNFVIYNIKHGYRFTSDIISLHYVKNTGAAFSLLKDSREILIILSVIALVLLFLYAIKHIKTISMKSLFFIALLSAGIAGNLHERISLGYVRDFFEFSFINNFPVFNVSDIFINIGVIALIILILIRKTK